MKLRVKVGDQSFDVEVGDVNARPILAKVEGETFEVWPEEAEKRPEEVTAVAVSAPAVTDRPAPAQITTKAQHKCVLAPIPGVIIGITIKEGDTVSFGQELCVLEAMKMKNLIRAKRSGTISAVRVAVGDQVKHSQVLMEYTD